MFKKLREKIESKRKSKNLFWKIFVMGKDFLWGVYTIPKKIYKKIQKPIKYFIKNYHFKTNLILRNFIKGKRVLILGSGASSSELKKIPEDVLIFTCNAGPRLLLEKNIDRRIDLFLCADRRMERRTDIQEYLKKSKINIFVINNLKYIQDKKELNRVYLKLTKDNNGNNLYLKKLIKPYKIAQIKVKNSLWRRGQEKWTSSGMRLLQYALYFNAKEIYLAGIDISEEGYFWNKNNRHLHKGIDRNFVKIISKKYNNIYSAVKSPINKYFKYKPLQ